MDAMEMLAQAAQQEVQEEWNNQRQQMLGRINNILVSIQEAVGSQETAQSQRETFEKRMREIIEAAGLGDKTASQVYKDKRSGDSNIKRAYNQLRNLRSEMYRLQDQEKMLQALQEGYMVLDEVREKIAGFPPITMAVIFQEGGIMKSATVSVAEAIKATTIDKTSFRGGSANPYSLRFNKSALQKIAKESPEIQIIDTMETYLKNVESHKRQTGFVAQSMLEALLKTGNANNYQFSQDSVAGYKVGDIDLGEYSVSVKSILGSAPNLIAAQTVINELTNIQTILNSPAAITQDGAKAILRDSVYSLNVQPSVEEYVIEQLLAGFG